MIELEDIATVCVMDLSVWETCVGLEGNDKLLVQIFCESFLLLLVKF